MNQQLGSTAKEEIRKAMTGLVGASAKAEATRQADLHGLSVAHVYEITRDVRGGQQRKRRSDAGKRKYTLTPGTDVYEAAALVIGAKLDPDEALRTAEANGHKDLPSLSHFQKLLRENEVGRRARRDGRRNHRRFEAAAPLDIVQIDSTALKVRWLDVNTRRIQQIVGIDKNHPQLDERKLRVWQVMAVDDHSRRRFLKYITTHHITSADMVRFCVDLFSEWGIPKVLYTDNGPEFKALFTQAVRILSSIPAIKESGGLEHKTHAPNNPQASGKVEVAHQWAEKMDKYVGLALDKAIEVTADRLDGFAEAICRNYNEARVNRSTGQTPLARWFGTQVTARMLPQDIVRAALLFREATRTLTDTMTVRVGNVDYRIPARDATGKASPFKKGTKLHVIVPDLLGEIFVTLPNGDEYAVLKEIANADIAGEFKTAAESHGEQITKDLREHHKQKNREARELKNTTGETYQVPFYNHEIEMPKTNLVVGAFPHPVTNVSAEDLAKVTPVPMDEVAAAAVDSGDATRRERASSDAATYTGAPMGYWEAVAEFADRFDSKDAAKAFLESIFPSREGTVPVTEIDAAITTHFNPQKEVANIRLAS